MSHSLIKELGEYGVDKEYENYVRVSPLIGIIGNYKVSEIISFHPEFLYTSKGGSYRLENSLVVWVGDRADEKAYYLNYLETPLLISVNLNRLVEKELLKNNLSLYFSYGIAPSYNVASSLRSNKFQTKSSSSASEDVDEKYNSEHIGYGNKFGLSYVLDLAINVKDHEKRSIYLSARFTQTMTDAYNVSRLNGYNMGTKISTLTLGCGVML